MTSNTRQIIYICSYTTLLIGAITYITKWNLGPYFFAVGAAGITLTFLTQNVKHLDFRKKRLHNFNILGGLLLIVSSGAMFNQSNSWIIYLTISAIFQTYAAFAGEHKSK